jgi:hypothetical protein
MDPGRAPLRIFLAHPLDEITQATIDLRAALLAFGISNARKTKGAGGCKPLGCRCDDTRIGSCRRHLPSIPMRPYRASNDPAAIPWL